jgi:hypothetical protein
MAVNIYHAELLFVTRHKYYLYDFLGSYLLMMHSSKRFDRHGLRYLFYSAFESILGQLFWRQIPHQLFRNPRDGFISSRLSDPPHPPATSLSHLHRPSTLPPDSTAAASCRPPPLLPLFGNRDQKGRRERARKQGQLMQPKISSFFKRQTTEPDPNRFVFFPPVPANLGISALSRFVF